MVQRNTMAHQTFILKNYIPTKRNLILDRMTLGLHSIEKQGIVIENSAFYMQANKSFAQAVKEGTPPRADSAEIPTE